MRLTLLGTGDARQVPVYNCSCPVCAAARISPARRRGPCCALIECGAQRWLIRGASLLGERTADLLVADGRIERRLRRRHHWHPQPLRNLLGDQGYGCSAADNRHGCHRAPADVVARQQIFKSHEYAVERSGDQLVQFSSGNPNVTTESGQIDRQLGGGL